MVTKAIVYLTDNSLDEKIAALVKKAADRAKANGRKTVSARDL